MKKIISALLLLIGSYSMAQSYLITKTTDKNKSFIIFHIRNENQDVAKLCLFDPKKTFDFFSNKSDPESFDGNIEKNLVEFAQKKKDSQPICVILGKFEESKNPKKIYPGYFLESVALLLIVPPYFENINIISTEAKASRFYLKIYIGDKYYYSLMVSENPVTLSEAKSYFRAVKSLNLNHRIKPVPINDFPVKLVSFDNGKARTVYASDSAENYTCLFMAVER